MKDVQLGKTYDNFIESLIEEGYYDSPKEVLRDALRLKMREMEMDRIASIQSLIAEGELSIKKGKTIMYDKDFLNKSFLRAKENLKNKKTLPQHITG